MKSELLYIPWVVRPLCDLSCIYLSIDLGLINDVPTNLLINIHSNWANAYFKIISNNSGRV